MSATSKRNRALLAGVEPVTDKAMYTGEASMPEPLAKELSANMADNPEPEEQESDDG